MSESTLRCRILGHKFEFVGPVHSLSSMEHEEMECERCGYSRETAYEVARCPECGDGFATRFELGVHIKSSHPDYAESITEAETQ